MSDHTASVAEVRLPQGVLIIGAPFTLASQAPFETSGLPGGMCVDPFWIAQSIANSPLAIWRLRDVWSELHMPIPAYLLTDAALAEAVGSAVAQNQLASRFIPWSQYFTCTLTIRPNRLGDLLPIIPTASRVQKGKLLFQFTFDAHLTDRFGLPAPGRTPQLSSIHADDTFTIAQPTDAKGDTTVVFQTRETGAVSIGSTGFDLGVSMPPLEIKEAWYESQFQITGYNVCDEADFSGKLVSGNGLTENHKEDFLYSARGIPMQGTGRATGGRYIRLQSMNTTWHRNAANNRDRVNDPTQVTFAYAAGIQGRYAVLQENMSAAVDPHVIPPHARFDIADVGVRRADDVGSAIDDYHIDNFLGTGAAVVTTWLARGITNKDVKFLGYK